MKKSIYLLLVVIALLTTGVIASAQEAAAVSPQVLAVDVPGTGMIFMRVRVPHIDMTLVETRELIWQRLADVLSPGLESGELLNGNAVKVRVPKDEDPQILVADQLIFAVDKDHAALNNSSQVALAEVWAANLALALDRWAYINRPLR